MMVAARRAKYGPGQSGPASQAARHPLAARFRLPQQRNAAISGTPAPAAGDNHRQEAIRQLVRREYGLAGTIRALPGYSDLNFRLDTGSGDYVLKLMHAGCEPVLVDLQIAAMTHLNERLEPPITPGVCRTLSGADTAWFADPVNGAKRLAWLIPFLPGELMARCRPWPVSLASSLGATLAAVNRALSDFDHPALERSQEWDLRQSHWLAKRAVHIESREHRQHVLDLAQHFEDHLSPRLSALPRSAIHGDANDMNILVTMDGNRDLRVSGLIDFGDMIATPRVCEPAIAIAYVMMGEGDALARARALLDAYHKAFPLEPAQLSLLPALVRLRWAVTVSNAALNRALNPDNAYLGVSEADALSLLRRFGENPGALSAAMTPGP